MNGSKNGAVETFVNLIFSGLGGFDMPNGGPWCQKDARDNARAMANRLCEALHSTLLCGVPVDEEIKELAMRDVNDRIMRAERDFGAPLGNGLSSLSALLKKQAAKNG